jgi:SAM-dependent methyltransferase
LKLHIGCGNTALDGFVNIDILPGCDISLDLNKDRLPFDDNSADVVFSHHALEHFDNYLFALEEIWRVLRHGGRFLLQVPYVTLTEYNLVNPYHKNYFNEFSFDFFEVGKLKGSANEASRVLFKKVFHRFHYMPEFADKAEPELTFCRRHYFNVVRAIDFGLYAIKPPLTMIEVPKDAEASAKKEMEECYKSRKRVSWPPSKQLRDSSGVMKVHV